MGKRMKAAVMTAIRTVEIQERPVPVPAPHEVLVQVEYVGVCGSDVHYYEHGRIGDYVVTGPLVLGHEVAGTVVETGSAVQNLKPGDRVALEPQITCGTCEFCKKGLYNLCRSVRFFATPPIDGVFQEYAVHPANLCFRLPDAVSTLSGALIEPLSVGLHAAFQGGAGLGQTAVVTGTGCIGLTALLALRACGASRVAVTDLFDKRLEKAKALGASAVFNSGARSPVPGILAMTGGRGFDLAIETTGSAAAVEQLVEAAKPGATIVLVGYSADGKMTIPLAQSLDKEITYKTIFRYRNSYPRAIASIAGGQIDVGGIVSHTYDFDHIRDALEDAIRNKNEVIKAVIKLR